MRDWIVVWRMAVGTGAAVCVFASGAASGQGLGGAAAKEKARREASGSKAAAPRYDDRSLRSGDVATEADSVTSADEGAGTAAADGKPSSSEPAKEEKPTMCGGLGRGCPTTGSSSRTRAALPAGSQRPRERFQRRRPLAGASSSLGGRAITFM
jgi:hypothetical protein